CINDHNLLFRIHLAFELVNRDSIFFVCLRGSILRFDRRRKGQQKYQQKTHLVTSHFSSHLHLKFQIHLDTLAPPPLITFSTSASVAIEVSPGVVMANAPCAAPYSTAIWGPFSVKNP